MIDLEARVDPAVGAAPLPARRLLVMRLRGTQEEMGAQHGRLVREHGGYQASVDYYRELPERLLFGTSPEVMASPLAVWLARTVKDVLLGRLQQRRPPEYLARSRAFMRALGLPASDARFLTVMDLFQNVVGIVGRLQLGPFSRRVRTSTIPACTTVAVWGEASAGGELRHARNFDFPGIGVWDRAPVVVFCEPDSGVRYGFVTTLGADTPGVTAFNEAGLVVTAHTRFHQDVSFDGAAIIDVGHDIVRRAESIADAVAIANERRIASTWGLAVSSARERNAVVIETTARKVEVVEAGGHRDHLSCANRYRHPHTRRGQLTAAPAWAVHSDARQQRIHELVEQGRGQGGLDAVGLQRLLDDHIDPGDPERPRGCGAIIAQALSVKSIVAEPASQAIHVSVATAPTGRGPYARVPWCWDGDVGTSIVAVDAALGSPDPAAAAFEHFVEANRIAEVFHSMSAAFPEIERAIALCPDDPSYRFIAGAMLMQAQDEPGALAHFERGLMHERIGFRRGQLLLWGSRAADLCGCRARAAELRVELLALDDDYLDEHRGVARREAVEPFGRRRIELSLLLADAQ